MSEKSGKKPSEVVLKRLLWHIAARGGEVFNSDLSPTAAVREALKEAKWIEVKEEKNPLTNRKSKLLKVTEAGFALCNQNMSWPEPKGNTERLIDALLKRIHVMFGSQRPVSSLGDFINASTLPETDGARQPVEIEPDASLSAYPKVEVEQAVRAACLELGGGHHSERVRLADLRNRLRGFTHDDVTEAVRNLARRNELTLYPFDDPRQVTRDDEAAAIESTTGVKQYILYFGGTHS